MKNLIQKLHVQGLPDYSTELAPYVLGVGSLPTDPCAPVEVRLYLGRESTTAVTEVPLIDLGYNGGAVAECPLVFPMWLIADGEEYANANDLIAGIQATLPAGVIAEFAADGCSIKLTHPRDYVPPINIPVTHEEPAIVEIPLVSSVTGSAVPCPIDWSDWTFPGEVTVSESQLLDQINDDGMLGQYHVAKEVVCNDDDEAIVRVSCPEGTGSVPGNIKLDPISAAVKRLPFLFNPSSAPVPCENPTTAAQGLYYPYNSTTTFASEVPLAAAIAAATSASEVTVRCIGGFLYAEGDFVSETSIQVAARETTTILQFTGADQAIVAPPWAKCATVKIWSGSSIEGDAKSGTSYPVDKRGWPAYVTGKVSVADLKVARVGRGGNTSLAQYGAGNTGNRYLRGGSPSGVYTSGGNAILLAGNPKRELRALTGNGLLSTGESFVVGANMVGISLRDVATAFGDELYSDGSLFGPLAGSYWVVVPPGGGGTRSSWMQIDFATPVKAKQVFFALHGVATFGNMRLAATGGTASIGDFGVYEAFGPAATQPIPSYTPATGAIGRPGGSATHRGLIISSDSESTLTRLRFTCTQNLDDSVVFMFGESVMMDGLAPNGYYGSSLATMVSGEVGSSSAPNSGDADYTPIATGQGTNHGVISIEYSALPC